MSIPSKKLGTRKVPREQRMQEILTVAGKVFAKQGFHSASMEEIAEGAGVTKPLLYRYFGSKDSLYLATIEEVGDYLVQGISMAMKDPDPIDRLQSATYAFLGFVNKHRDGWAVLYNETMNAIGPVGERVSFFRSAFVQAATQTMQEILGEPENTTPSKAESLANTLIGAVEAMARWWILHPAVPLQDVHRMLGELLMPGLKQLQATP